MIKIGRCVENVEVHKYVNIEDIDCFASGLVRKGYANIKSESIDVMSVVSNIFKKI